MGNKISRTRADSSSSSSSSSNSDKKYITMEEFEKWKETIISTQSQSHSSNLSDKHLIEIEILKAYIQDLEKSNKVLNRKLKEKTFSQSQHTSNSKSNSPHKTYSFLNTTNGQPISLADISQERIDELVEQVLKNENINISAIPDFIERKIYRNVFSIFLNLVDEMIKTTSIDFMGHSISMKISPNPNPNPNPTSSSTLKTKRYHSKSSSPVKEKSPTNVIDTHTQFIAQNLPTLVSSSQNSSSHNSTFTPKKSEPIDIAVMLSGKDNHPLNPIPFNNESMKLTRENLSDRMKNSRYIEENLHDEASNSNSNSSLDVCPPKDMQTQISLVEHAEISTDTTSDFTLEVFSEDEEENANAETNQKPKKAQTMKNLNTMRNLNTMKHKISKPKTVKFDTKNKEIF